MIYSIDGTPLNAAYNKIGESLSAAYDIDGNQIFSAELVPDYTKYRILPFLNVALWQGMDIHGDVMAVWNGQQSVILRELATGNEIATVNTGITSHGNDITFTDEYYDPSDEFPILCIGTYNFCRITRNSATQVMKITFPANGHDMAYGCVFDGNIMYALGYANGYTYSEGNYIRIMKLDMSDLTDNGNGTFSPAVLDTVDRDWLPCIQGASFHDGMIWIACGMSYPANVYGLDADTGEILVDIDLVRNGELEGLAWAYNDTDDWYAVVGQKGQGFRKIVFEQV